MDVSRRALLAAAPAAMAAASFGAPSPAAAAAPPVGKQAPASSASRSGISR